MRVTFDWDDDDARNGNLNELREKYDHRPWELRRSSSGDGWHFIVYEAFNDTPRGFSQTIPERDDYDDDAKRLRLDRERWGAGSPLMQVLYRRKYMDRHEPPAKDGTGYSTGHDAEVVEQNQNVKAAPEEERIKDPDTDKLDYQKALKLARREKGFSQAELAEYLQSTKTYAEEPGGKSRSTISDYERGQRSVDSASVRRWVRRTVRTRGLGHMAETADGGKAADEVRYVDRDTERRTLVEYIDVPVGVKEEAKGKDYENLTAEDREYGLLNVHTGTYNDNHSDGQLRAIHEDVTSHVLEVLSPESPVTGTKMGGPSGLDEQNRHFTGESGWTREPDSVNWERELLDEDEDEVYLSNLPDHPSKPDEPGQYPLFEVILWDEDMQDMEWHVIGLWTGSTVRDATVVKDRGLGVW